MRYSDNDNLSGIFIQKLFSCLSNGFLLVSMATNWVSLEEVCLPSFEVLNSLLNLVTINR